MLPERQLFLVDKVGIFRSCGSSFLPVSAATPVALSFCSAELRRKSGSQCYSLWTIFSDSMYVNE